MSGFTWSYGDQANTEEVSLLELFHENTKLSPASHNLIETGDKPSVEELYLMSRGFRSCKYSEKHALPEIDSSDVPLQLVMLQRRSRRNIGEGVELGQLATLLGQALGTCAIVNSGTKDIPQVLRTWPSAGALYPLETYVVSSRVNALEEGLYHYNVMSHELERLPSAGAEQILHDGYFGQDFVVRSACVILLVAVFDRTRAKYGDPRAYRLVALDAGHAAQNVLLTAEQLGLGAVALQGFCDDELARHLNIDGVHESVIHSIAVGGIDD